MYKITEAIENDEASDIYYQTPEDLKASDDEHMVVFHDDDLIQDDHESKYVSPIEIVNKAKADPSTVSIAKKDDQFYVSYRDLKNYMDASNTKDYSDAVDAIIDAHLDEQLNRSSIHIVMGLDDVNHLDSYERFNMEESSVNFEIFK